MLTQTHTTEQAEARAYYAGEQAADAAERIAREADERWSRRILDGLAAEGALRRRMDRMRCLGDWEGMVRLARVAEAADMTWRDIARACAHSLARSLWARITGRRHA